MWLQAAAFYLPILFLLSGSVHVMWLVRGIDKSGRVVLTLTYALATVAWIAAMLPLLKPQGAQVWIMLCLSGAVCTIGWRAVTHVYRRRIHRLQQ